MVLYLTVPPEVASARSAYGSERYENLYMQRRVREQFKLVSEEIQRQHGSGIWHEVTAEGTIEEVKGKIAHAIEGLSEGNSALGRLWM
jgi:dTMP kinase